MSEDLRELVVKTLYKAISPNFEVTFADGYQPAADAVLALFDVEEEWGLVWPPTGDVDWIGTEAEARGVALLAQPPELATLRDLSRLRRRYVLTTKPIEVQQREEVDG